MTSVTDATAAASATGATNSSAATAALTSDFDTFIKLLTTQVTNQDPLEPLESTQFVEQLATFSALEQQIATNSNLETIVSLLQNDTDGTADLLNKTVSTQVATVQGPIDPLTIVPGESVAEGTLVVTNSSGKEVYRGTPSTSFTWDGTTTDGEAVGLDNYTFSIETAGGNVGAAAIGIIDRVVLTDDGQVVGLGDGVLTGSYTILGSE